MPRLLSLVLCLLLLPVSGSFAQTLPGVPDVPRSVSAGAAPATEGGWDLLARWLNALKPGVDTRLAATPSQITDRIEALLDAGRHQQALELIQTQQQIEQARYTPGTDVQLAFLHARALAAIDDDEGAERIYKDLTTRYPELPEPWNNLAALYLQRGQVDLAQQALQTAVLIAPTYGTAHANLADIQLMLARQSYETAAQLGVSSAQQRARAVGSLSESP